MKNLFLIIFTFLFKRTPEFHKNNPRGIYRIPGETETIPNHPTKQSFWLQRLRERLNKMSYDNFLDHVWKTFGFLLVFCSVCAALFIGSKILLNSGNVDYCYIERWTYVKEINVGLMPPKEDPNPNQTTKKNSIPEGSQNLVIVYELKGHRNWREDRQIGRFESLDSAIEGAHKLNCAVEAK